MPRISRHRLFYEAKSRGKLRSCSGMWITMTFEAGIHQSEQRLFMAFDYAFVGAVSNARARSFRTCFARATQSGFRNTEMPLRRQTSALRTHVLPPSASVVGASGLWTDPISIAISTGRSDLRRCPISPPNELSRSPATSFFVPEWVSTRRSRASRSLSLF